MYKENVTLYLYERDKYGKHYYLYNKKIPETAGIKLSIDTPEDLDRTKKIVSCFTKPHWEYNLEDIFEIWKKLGYG